jgi:hypothetical protein
MKQTAVDFLITEIEKTDWWLIRKKIPLLIEQAKEMEKYNSKIQAKKYYLKGFEVAELTENQGCSHEQTMRDAESFFEILYPLKE